VGVEDVSHETSSTPSVRPLHPGTDAPSLVALLEMALDADAWEAFSRGSAIRRAGRAGFARNVCVALGNWGASVENPPAEAIALLSRALVDPEPLVRGHAAWALGRVGGAAASELLSSTASVEADAWVLEELGAEVWGAGRRSPGEVGDGAK
jgi:epoxyqueuosine reductase